MKNHLKNSSAAPTFGRRLSFTSAILALSLLLFSANPAVAIWEDPIPLPPIVTIIDDNFTDGITNNAIGQLGFQTFGSPFSLDLAQAPGPVDFASGDSVRTIHSLFPATTLVAFGNRLTFTFDFTTPDTIAFDSGGPSFNEDFKFGLFDTTNTTLAAGNVPDSNTGLEIDFSGPISLGNAVPNVAVNPLAGIQGELDNTNAPGTALGLRTNNVNNFSDPNVNVTAQGAQFLQSNAGFDFIAGGNNDVITLLPNSNYTGSITVEFTDASLTSLDITVGMLDAAGTFNDSFTTTVSIADTPSDLLATPPVPGNVGVNTTTFDLIAFNATSGAFGGTDGPTPGSSNTGEPNNGIDISNVTITFETAAFPTVLRGDADVDGDVDFADIPVFISFLQSGIFQAESDADCSGMVDFSDIPAFVEILQAQ